MYLDQLNLNQLRVFESVCRTRSMTAAAAELHLTQSGISQHIRSLEDKLGIKLFDRINQKIVPTALASNLYEDCSKLIFALEQALLKVKDGGSRMFGSVAIGMPIEFGNNLVVPLLSEFGSNHPEIQYRLQLGFASDMNSLLLAGELDFAFVDEFTMDKRIATERILDETLELCVSGKSAMWESDKKFDQKFFEKLQYVEYQEGQPLLRMWFNHHLKQRNIRLNVRATVMDVQGIARFVVSGFGAGIIPGYLCQKLQKDGHKIHRFKGCGRPLKNAISVAYLRDRTHSVAASTLLSFLKSSLIKKN